MLMLSMPLFLKGISILLGFIFAGVIYRKYKKALSYADKYIIAINDIDYLLNVEDLHCRNNKEVTGQSMRNLMRLSVIHERGLTWSGKNTKSSISKELLKAKKIKSGLTRPLDKITSTAFNGTLK